MTKRIVFVLCLALTGLAGCDTDRVNRLETENATLKAKVDKADAARDFDLQAKCAKDSRAWFQENWGGSRDKDTIFLDFTNHYNAKRNKCFVLVEYHYNSHFANSGGFSWTNAMSLTDVYENSKYALFAENHYTYYNPKFSTGDEVITCDVSGEKCKTFDEFSNLVRPYVND